MSERNETSVFADDVSPGAAEDAKVRDESTGPERSGEMDAALRQLEQENASLKDQLLRQRAEFENFRRRTAKEKEDLREYASIETIRPVLAIADDFERALAVECADAGFAKGMELIYQRMTDALRKIGVEPLDAVGAPFDPNLHHAIDRVKTAGVPENTVLEVLQQGYTFKGKLIRPAIVKVAVEPDAA